MDRASIQTTPNWVIQKQHTIVFLVGLGVGKHTLHGPSSDLGQESPETRREKSQHCKNKPHHLVSNSEVPSYTRTATEAASQGQDTVSRNWARLL